MMCVVRSVFKTGGLFVALCFLLSCAITGTAWANEKYASMVMDADTGAILSQSHADKMVYPASITKVMTLLLLFEEIDAGRIRLNDRIPISRNAASMVPSKLGLRPGSSIRVQDAIYALVTKSANDIAVAVGEKIGKTEANFARMMTAKAHKIGMSRTRFMNASGLHHPKQVTTARDMAKLGRYMVSMKPSSYRYFSRKEFSYLGKRYKNHNHLLGEYDGMDGIKTGYIQASGFNLLASAKRGNRRLIGVVFGGKTSKSRNDEMRKLLDRGFQKVGALRLAQKAPIPVKNPRRSVMPDFKVIEPEVITVATAPPASPLTKNLLEADSDNIRIVEAKTGVISAPQSEVISVVDAVEEPQSERPSLEDKRMLVAQNMAYIYKAQRQSQPVLAAQKVNQVPIDVPNVKMKTLGTLTLSSLQETPSTFHHLNTTQQRDWGIQIGAYSERDTTNKMLHEAYQKLPRPLQYAVQQVAPIQGQDGWIYRARLTGFTYSDAKSACLYYKDCMIIDP